jgi:hypothetical protein
MANTFKSFLGASTALLVAINGVYAGVGYTQAGTYASSVAKSRASIDLPETKALVKTLTQEQLNDIIKLLDAWKADTDRDVSALRSIVNEGKLKKLEQLQAIGDKVEAVKEIVKPKEYRYDPVQRKYVLKSEFKGKPNK